LGEIRDALLEEAHLARRGREHAAEDGEQRRLAAPARPGEHHDLAALDVEVHALERLEGERALAEHLADAPGVDDPVAHHRNTIAGSSLWRRTRANDEAVTQSTIITSTVKTATQEGMTSANCAERMPSAMRVTSVSPTRLPRSAYTTDCAKSS